MEIKSLLWHDVSSSQTSTSFRGEKMITGIHALVYSKAAEKDRSFFQDVLGFRSVDVGHGWLIFALPPAELAVHPAEGDEFHELYLMCDDVEQAVKELKAKRVKCSAIKEAGWGAVTMITLPGGGRLGLYQPRHPTAIPPSPKKKAGPRKARRSSGPNRR